MVIKRHSSSKDERQEPEEEIRRCIKTMGQCNTLLRIAFIGFPGHGKSSVQNTVASFSSNPPKLKQLARAGHGDNNITKLFTDHELVVWHAPTGENRVSKIILVDTPGQCCKELMLEEQKLEHSLNRGRLLRDAIVEQVVGPLHQAGTTCLVLVISAQQVWQDAKRSMTRVQQLRGAPLQLPHDCPSHSRLQTLRQIQNIGGDHGMRAVCILTHADEVDRAVRRDAAKARDSCTLDRIRAYTARQLGMSLNLVHVMVNLLHEPDPADNPEVGRLALAAFCHALQAAEDGHNELVTSRNPRHRKAAGDDEIDTHRSSHIRSVC